MKILALEEEMPNLTPADFAPHRVAEAKRVWELQQAGILREVYFRTDRHTTVLILECEGTREAEAILASLPLVTHGLIRFQPIPLAPYSGLSRLFSPADA